MTAITHHHLTAEQINDKHGPAIMLTQQDDCYDPTTVVVHPWQLRAVCEQFGIIASGPQASQAIAALQRRMMGLRDRINGLSEWMAEHSDHKHADLTYETTQLQALQDLAREWCHDFDDGQVQTECGPAQAELL